MASHDLELLASRVASGNVSERLPLDPPLVLDPHEMGYRSVIIEREMKSRTRPRLLRFEGQSVGEEEGTSSARRFLLKQEDLTLEASAMRLLEDMNARFRDHDLQYCGIPVLAQTYGILPIGTSAGLVEFVPGAVTLGRLKRESKLAGRDPQKRVSEYMQEGLDSIDATWENLDDCIAKLVATTAAYLVTNFVLGVADGHEDNVMLLRDGTLFRVDFGHVFGEAPSLDSPLIWLPKAVKVAIGKHWRAVEQLCSVALTIAAPWIMLGTEHQDLAWQSIYATAKHQERPSGESSATESSTYYGAISLRWFLALLELDLALGTAAVRYSWLLRRTGWSFFKEQFDCIDSAWLKTIKNIGHDFLGYNDAANPELLPTVLGAGRASKEDRKLVYRRLQALLATDDQDLQGTLRSAASSLFAAAIDLRAGRGDGAGEDPAALGLAKEVITLLAQCEIVPLAARLLADDQHAQWLLPSITARAMQTLEEEGAELLRREEASTSTAPTGASDDRCEGAAHHDNSANAELGESPSEGSTPAASRLGALACFQRLPTSLVRDANKLLRYATNRIPGSLPGSRHRPRAFRVLLRLAGSGSDEVRTLRHRQDQMDDGDEHENRASNGAAATWGAFCRGGMDEGARNSHQTEAEHLVEMAALGALQSMQEDGAEHAEEVFRLMEESLHNEDLAHEALKTLCLMAPASPLNAYKRGARTAAAAEAAPHEASARLARLLSA